MSAEYPKKRNTKFQWRDQRKESIVLTQEIFTDMSFTDVIVLHLKKNVDQKSFV